MSPDSPPLAPRPPHPLAIALIDRLRPRPSARVVELGPGSGRNTRALEAAGFTVVAPAPDAGAQAGLSTHALLHGTPATIATALRTIAAALLPGAPFFGTFGSVHDARHGTGNRIEPFVFAPREGDEAGVAHAFFDEERLRELLSADWNVESLHEVEVDDVAGKWAHGRAPLHGAIHWFVIATKRER